jgi:hypothetical protein
MVRLTFGIAMLAAALAVPPAAAQVPADVGQVWQTYDLRPFTAQAGPGSERHVVDWVLQETGYPAWHGAHAASLSAGGDSLGCFHTPEMQARVADVVGRFTQDAATPHRFTIRVFGMGSPAWRGDVRPVLRPLPVATPGVQAWIVSREDAAVVVGRIRGRSDCQELPTGPVLAANGIPAQLAGGRKLPYVQDVAARPDAWPGWQMQNAACDEGFAIDLHPLLSRDGTAVEAVFRCRIDQIERMASVALASPSGDPGGVRVEVPQVAAVRVGERFRWPATHTLLVSLGLVPWPVPAQNTAVASLLSDTKRRDVIVAVEPRLRGAP